MRFDDSYEAWLAAEHAARAANDKVFSRVQGVASRMSEEDAEVLAALRGDASAKMQRMLEAANDRHAT
jgi:hypothetical protein